MTLGRLFRTARYLKPEQIYRRALRRFPERAPAAIPAPAIRQLAWPLWVEPALRSPALVGDGRFEVLGEAHRIATVGWDNPAIAKLWRYNLHYFDDLVSTGWSLRTHDHRAFIVEWIAANPAASGTGWEPYPLSRRIVNWIKWLVAGNAPVDGMIESLVLQTQWLTRRMEYHLLGNHLFTNGKALVFAGLFFSGEPADRWLEMGLAILERELDEQMLADGGHFELSTMYHALALEDLLDIANLVASAEGSLVGSANDLLKRCRACASAALAWLQAMCHPDGEIAFFNDAAFGIAPSPAELSAYAARLQIAPAARDNPTWLRETGYVRANRGRAALFADVARIGPDYLPGHAHADTLSFELSLGNDRFLVNGGTSVYGTGDERVRQRGTLAHNTVAIAQANSSEVWSGFRVGRRAYPRGISLHSGPDATIIEASHDGYRWMKGAPTHTRIWRLDGEGLNITDRISSLAAGPAVAAFRFHPDLHVVAEGDGMSGTATAPSGTQFRWSVSKGSAKVSSTTWHPRFGEVQPARQLQITLDGGESVVRFAWERA